MAHERIASRDGHQEAIVSWIDDGQSVQLGMAWDDAPAPGAVVAVPEGTRDEQQTGPPPVRAELVDGRWSIHMDLPRAQINELIRALRRGRNKAYGADE